MWGELKLWPSSWATTMKSQLDGCCTTGKFTCAAMLPLTPKLNELLQSTSRYATPPPRPAPLIMCPSVAPVGMLPCHAFTNSLSMSMEFPPFSGVLQGSFEFE